MFPVVYHAACDWQPECLDNIESNIGSYPDNSQIPRCGHKSNIINHG